MGQTAGGAEYSIAAVSKLTGIGCHALRVWERRYGFPIPRRAPSGHRRYGADQVAILRQVAQGIARGQPLAELMASVRNGGLRAGPEPVEAPAETPISALLDRLLAGDLEGAEAAYARSAEGRACDETVRLLLTPALVEVGERWFRGECDVFQEHAATAFLRQKIGALLAEARGANPHPRRSAVVGTVQGDRHEGGVMMLSLLLECSGWRAKSLGVDLPVREYQKAINLWRPDAVCVSFVLSRNINKRFDELARLKGAPVFVGGRSLVNYQALARRHGLRPLIGAAEQTVRRLIEEVESARGPEGEGGAS